MKDGIQYILYNLPEEQGEVQVVVENETLWCTQKAMAQLFGVGVPAISKHLKNIFDEGELRQERHPEPLSDNGRRDPPLFLLYLRGGQHHPG